MGHHLKKRVVCKYHWSDYATPDPKHFLAQASSLDLFLLVFLSELPVLLARYCQYILEEERLVPVQRWLLLECLYRLVFQLSLGLLLHQIAHLYTLVFQLFQELQSLLLEFLYILVLTAPVQALRSLQTARLYRLVFQSFLVPPKPQTGHPQPLAQLFPVQRWHQLEFPDTQVVERLARLQRLLLLGYLYILVFQLSLGLQALQLARLYILVMEPASQALLLLQTEVLHLQLLPS